MPNLHIAARQPIWRTDLQFFESLTGRVSSYGHELQAFGGYWKADITLSVSASQLEDWFTNGLGRDIIVKSPGLTTMFEGCVNRISGDIGTASFEVGPLLGVANRVAAAYASYTPIGGSGIQLLTDYADDTTSQGLYGILYHVFSASNTTLAEAEYARDIYLLENAWPQLGQSVATDKQGKADTITLEVMGYVHFLDTYPFNDLTDPLAYVNLTTKVMTILAASSSSIFSSSTANVTTNSTIQVPSFERDDAIAMELITGMVDRGSGDGRRALFGIYENREAHYGYAPTTVAYEHSIRENRKAFYHYGTNQPVFNGLVRPGRFVRLRDSPFKGMRGDNMRSEDVFIERVAYNGDNDSVQITSSKFSTFEQVMSGYGV